MVASRMVLIPKVLRELRVEILVELWIETRRNPEIPCPKNLLLLCAEGVNLAYTLFKTIAILRPYEAITWAWKNGCVIFA